MAWYKSGLLLGSLLACGWSQEMMTKTYEEVRDYPITRFQLLNAHNAYHQRPTPYVPEAYIEFPALADLMDTGVRGMEFDVWPTPVADEFLVCVPL